MPGEWAVHSWADNSRTATVWLGCPQVYPTSEILFAIDMHLDENFAPAPCCCQSLSHCSVIEMAWCVLSECVVRGLLA
jgi:hypothetical protein